ncbi:hypothetical protein ACLB2K_029278 [Fragaria x ananassa]
MPIFGKFSLVLDPVGFTSGFRVESEMDTTRKRLNKYTWFWSFPNDKNVEYICSAIVTDSQHVQVPIPTPKKNEVLLKLEAASLNPGDCKIQKGQARPIFPRKLPHIPVTDVAGEVVELGEDVKNFKVGDKVVAMLSYGYGGGLGEFAAANAEMVVARPSEVSAADGAGLPVAALSAHWALTKDAEIKLHGTDEPKNILITGASGNVGLYAVQLAKLGNAHVTATCGARINAPMDWHEGYLKIWKAKNDTIFRDVITTATNVVAIVAFHFNETALYKAVIGRGISQTTPSTIRWLPPHNNYIKINFDGFVQGRSTTEGFVFRNSDGNVILAAAKGLGSTTIPTTEATALRDSLVKAKD